MENHGRTRWLYLEPLDSWSFGDGRPNRAGENQSDLGCLFPPSALTVAGAIRAPAARALGWSGGPHDRWSADIIARLGDGLDPGPLRFTGPFLARGGELLFPAPAHLLGIMDGGGAWHPADLLVPGRETSTDLHATPVRLPERAGRHDDPASPLKPPSGVWLTAEGLSRVLAGKLPDAEHCVLERELFVFERRVGLALEENSRTAREGHLYSPVHVRLQREVGLLVGAEGLDPQMEIPALLPLGGEGRMAVCEEVIEPAFPAADGAPPEEGWSCLLALTPVRMLDASDTRWEVPRPGDPAARLLPDLQGEVVSLCLERPLRLGGWDSVGRRPLPLTPYVRAGTIWFLRADEALPARAGRAGSLTAFGFGHLVPGHAPAAASTPHLSTS